MNKSLCMLSLICSLPAFAAKGKIERPNIIFLLTDDQRDDSFGQMGHPWVKTPNCDKLIQDGIRFRNTYIAEPTSAPSRVALFTGMHERMNGVGFSSSYKLTEQQWEDSYPALLRKSGYYTGFIGKFGVEYYNFDARSKFDYWWGHDGWTKFFPKDYDTPSTKPYHKAKENLINSITGEAMEDFLNTTSKEKPFCLSVSFSTPHGSQIISMFPEMKEAVTLMQPSNLNPKLKGHPIYDNLYRNIDIKIPEQTGSDPYNFIPKFVLDQDKGRRNQLYAYNYNAVSNKEHHIRYYQQITDIDMVIGKLVENLKKRGLFENTIIIFTSDNGLLMGECGMGGKELLYDLTSRVPCFIYDPNIKPSMKGRTVSDLVSSLDLTSTILDYANVKQPEYMEGSSLRPYMLGKIVKPRKAIFLESLFTMRGNPFCEGIREGKWKYIRMYKGKSGYLEKDIDFRNRKPDFEQLFNMETDPGESINLIDTMNGSTLLEKLRKKCQIASDKMNGQRRKYMKSVICELRR